MREAVARSADGWLGRPGNVDLLRQGRSSGPIRSPARTFTRTGLLPSNFPNLNDFHPYHNYTGHRLGRTPELLQLQCVYRNVAEAIRDA